MEKASEGGGADGTTLSAPQPSASWQRALHASSAASRPWPFEFVAPGGGIGWHVATSPISVCRVYDPLRYWQWFDLIIAVIAPIPPPPPPTRRHRAAAAAARRGVTAPPPPPSRSGGMGGPIPYIASDTGGIGVESGTTSTSMQSR